MQIIARRAGKVEIAPKAARQLAGLRQFRTGKSERRNAFHTKDCHFVLAVGAHADGGMGTVIEDGL